MGDMGEVFNAWKDMKRKVREQYGVECPKCKEVRPKANPSILLPRQKCKVDGYKDPRPRLTDEQRHPGWTKGGSK